MTVLQPISNVAHLCLINLYMLYILTNITSILDPNPDSHITGIELLTESTLVCSPLCLHAQLHLMKDVAKFPTILPFNKSWKFSGFKRDTTTPGSPYVRQI